MDLGHLVISMLVFLEFVSLLTLEAKLGRLEDNRHGGGGVVARARR